MNFEHGRSSPTGVKAEVSRFIEQLSVIAGKIFSLREFTFSIIILLPIIISGCASAQKRTVMDVKREVILRAAAQEAFKQAEPLLLKLKPGDLVDETGLTWPVHNINQADKIIGQVTYSNGWIECMSGGVSQAFYKFGALYGRSRQTVYGMHVFGYVTDDFNIVPRYLLKTQATIIRPSEYDRLEKSKTPNIGWTWTPGKNTKTYLKSIKVKEVQALDFTEPAPALGEGINIDSYINSYLTPDKFREAKKELKQLEKGFGLMEVIKALGGALVMKPTGEDFMVLNIKGFLNLTDEYRGWSKSTPDGVFTVWGFGYAEGGEEIAKLALIFRNAEVFKVVPYGTRKELEKYFSAAL